MKRLALFEVQVLNETHTWLHVTGLLNANWLDRYM